MITDHILGQFAICLDNIIYPSKASAILHSVYLICKPQKSLKSKYTNKQIIQFCWTEKALSNEYLTKTHLISIHLNKTLWRPPRKLIPQMNLFAN